MAGAARVPRWGGLLHRAPPSVRAALMAVVSRQPAGSRLRRRVLTAAAQVGWAEFNRRADQREFDRVLRFYDPACESYIGPGFPIDAEPVYHGHAGVRAFMRMFDEVAAVSFDCEEAVDMGGPCFGLLLSVSLTGAESGAPVPPIECVCTYTTRHGLIVRQDIRNDGWDEAPAELAVALER